MAKCTMIIGEPAVGKSTIMKGVLQRGDWRFDNTIKYIPCHWQSPNRCIIGRYDEPMHKFPGTDRMSMACQKHVIQFILQNPEVIFLFEGDRLGNDTMIKHMQHLRGLDFQVIQICTTPEILTERRSHRTQTAQFLRSRKTKIANMTGPAGRCGRTSQPIMTLLNNGPADCDAIVDYLVNERL